LKLPSRKSVGNSIAPWRFILFTVLFVGGLIVGIALVDVWQKSVMLSFDGATAVFLLSLWPVIRDGEASSIKRQAARNDANRGVLLFIAVIIIAVLFVTIVMELSAPGKPPALLIVGTLILAWLFSNVIYSLHYAHLFYGIANKGSGLDFPNRPNPDYWDFMYFAFTLGMTFQTSDVDITDPQIRRVALAQCAAAFLFNIGVLAFTINILGS
jgi:uncharacterized membrane protein